MSEDPPADFSDDDPLAEYSGDTDSFTVIDDFESDAMTEQTGSVSNDGTQEEDSMDTLDDVLGKRVIAYSRGEDETLLKFEDGTILQWQGYYSYPLHSEKDGLGEIWEERAEWVEGDDDDE